MNNDPGQQELIFALSAKGEISFNDFNSILETLYYDKGFAQNDTINWNDTLRDTRRFLESLGYCDVDYDDGKVYACPPAIVLLPRHGLPSAILTGTYTPSVVEELKDFEKKNSDVCICEWLKHPQERVVSEFIPKTFCITAERSEIIASLAEKACIDIQISAPSASLLLQFSNCSAKIYRHLQFTERAQPLDPEGWNKKEFNVSELRFSSENYSVDNFRLAQYRQQNKRYFLKFWIWHNNKCAPVDLNWGRWLMLQKAKKNVMAYDYKNRQLFCPSSVPLPRLLARAMTLCSGTMPHQETLCYEDTSFKRVVQQGELRQTYTFDVYDEVSQSMAVMLRNKLGQPKLHHSDFHILSSTL